mmetsp:Transcript_9991/g.37255  ORF Transcript_9991/g.37255 Transcript_9991/m.37255 type:complete len:155 (-) Transcript_9991:4745-5209(-)
MQTAFTSSVLMLAATNFPWTLDSAIMRRFQKRIYIPLPDLEARETIFELGLGDTDHDLSQKDFHELAQKTDEYSGSDINTIVRNALMEPLRKAQRATFFKQVEKDGDMQKYWMPTTPDVSGAIPMTLDQVEPNRLLVPPVTMEDFLQALNPTGK